MDNGIDDFTKEIAAFLDRYPYAGYNLYGAARDHCVWLYRAMTVEDAAFGIKLESAGVSVSSHDFGVMPPPINHGLVSRVKQYLPNYGELLVSREIEAAQLEAVREVFAELQPDNFLAALA